MAIALVIAGQRRGEKHPGAHSIAECNVDPVPSKRSLAGRFECLSESETDLSV